VSIEIPQNLSPVSVVALVVFAKEPGMITAKIDASMAPSIISTGAGVGNHVPRLGAGGHTAASSCFTFYSVEFQFFELTRMSSRFHYQRWWRALRPPASAWEQQATLVAVW
jgi:hypothetical protein